MNHVRTLNLALLLALSFIFDASVGFAADPDDSGSKKNEPREETVVTTHTVTIGGELIHYTATAGTIVLKAEEKGNVSPKASVFYVAYTRTGDGITSASRPITFSFNGGPGSSSVWLHLGLLGPRRVKFADETGNAPAPPYELIDNEYSLLDASDLVFIDPVSTGYSRPAPGEDPAQFHGVQEDVKSVGEFIRVYVTRHQRWQSPKYLIGESYGTTRAAGLSEHLQEEFGMYLNGIMLVSTVLDFQTINFQWNNDLPCILFLPTYTATAWYHKKLGEELQALPLADVLRQAETFAQRDYALALLQGDALDETEKDRIATEFARLTGIDKTYVSQANLRVNIWRFTKELLRDRRRTVGRFDSRITGIDRDAAGEAPSGDPSYALLRGIFSSAFYAYVGGELNYKSDLPYEILTGKVHPWKWGNENRYLDVAKTLSDSINFNPHLRVLIASGYYDLATPYLSAIYTANHLALDPELRGNVTLTFYEGGHMMYIHQPSLAQMRTDLTEFVADANP